MSAELMTLDEVARRLGMTPDEVRRQVLEGKLPAHDDGDADAPFWSRAVIERAAAPPATITPAKVASTSPRRPRAQAIQTPDMSPHTAGLRSVKQVAAWFDISIRSVWRRVKGNLLPRPIYPWVRCPRWRQEDLERIAAAIFGT
jgi:predicted DNA-binding transcriptional regulator AlpA